MTLALGPWFPLIEQDDDTGRWFPSGEIYHYVDGKPRPLTKEDVALTSEGDLIDFNDLGPVARVDLSEPENVYMAAAAPEMFDALARAVDMLQELSKSTNSYCELCEEHAEKTPDSLGFICGPVIHKPDCPIGLGRAALAKAKGEGADEI
jgi:hypothetical protein